MKRIRTKFLVYSFTLIACLQSASAREVPVPEDIKSYCLDFNWAERGGFAEPGKWSAADPAATVEWHKTIGSNVIQTFCVSTNGYAWYKNGVVTEQPGLKHDFLREVVRLGHAEGMLVMGYFCISANTRWGEENPELSYGTPSKYHIPYTDEYLAYLHAAITDAVSTTGIDGFMIDWVWQPERKPTGGKWIAAEKKLYQQLMGEPFPSEDELTKEQDLAYSRQAIDRAWKTIHQAAKEANPECLIWLTTNNVNHPHVVNSDMYEEVDWFMGEKGNINEIKDAEAMVGEDAHLITCLAFWNNQDATVAVPRALQEGIGLYGFAKPAHNSKGIIPLDRILPKQISELSGDDRSIAVLARAYHGKSIDSVWNGETFVEADPPPFRIKFRGRQGWSDTAHVSHENDIATIRVNTPYRSGRSVITRAGDNWPSNILVQLIRRDPSRPAPNHFRIANGEIGVGIVQQDGIKVIAGEMKGGLELREPWYAQHFLNEGNPATPVDAGKVHARITEEEVEILVPKIITQGNPESIAFEWCNGEKLR